MDLGAEDRELLLQGIYLLAHPLDVLDLLLGVMVAGKLGLWHGMGCERGGAAAARCMLTFIDARVSASSMAFSRSISADASWPISALQRGHVSIALIKIKSTPYRKGAHCSTSKSCSLLSALYCSSRAADACSSSAAIYS